MIPFLAVVKKELASVARDRTILIAILIQLFIASFSSALLISLLSLYDADSAGLYNALNLQVAVINEALCKGCGTCVASCPSGSIVQRLFEDEEVFAEIEGVLAYDA